MSAFKRLLLVSAAFTGLWAADCGIAVAQQAVGSVGAANASPTARAPSHVARTLKSGGEIFFKDHIATKRGGSAQLTFLDRSTLSIGENSEVVIDEFIYKPGAGGAMGATLAKGVLRFVGGEISHGGGTMLKTPVVTIGIRGGIGTVGYIKDAAGIGRIPGVPPGFHGGTIVVDEYGTFTVRNRSGEMVISRPGFAVFVGSAYEPIAAPVRFEIEAAKALMKILTSREDQSGGASTKTAASVARAENAVRLQIPIAVPRSSGINALDYTSVFSAGNALARNKSQARQALEMQQQIRSTPPPAPTPTPPPVTTPPPAPTPTPPPVTTPTPAPPSRGGNDNGGGNGGQNNGRGSGKGKNGSKNGNGGGD